MRPRTRRRFVPFVDSLPYRITPGGDISSLQDMVPAPDLTDPTDNGSGDVSDPSSPPLPPNPPYSDGSSDANPAIVSAGNQTATSC